MSHTKNQRIPDAEIDDLFLKRWSPVSFSDRVVEEDALASLFEAARWSPSSYNEQPWLFVYAHTESRLPTFRSLLVDGNRVWAEKAPVLLFVFAKLHFDRDGTSNHCAAFDTGAATLALSLQAVRLGLATHAMAGIRYDLVYEELGVPANEYQAICAIAIGYHDADAELSPELAGRDTPSSRKPVAAIAYRGRFTK